MHTYEFSLLDIVPYYIVLALFYFVINKKITSKKKAQYCFVILFVFSAIRYGIGYDYYSYKALATRSVLEHAYERMEPLSEFLLEIAYRSHYQVFFAVGAFLTLYPLYKVYLKHSISPVYSLLIYYLFPLFFLGNQSIVRNGIAFTFVFCAFTLLLEKGKKNLILSIVFLACACFFHKSALVGVLIYPLFYVKHFRSMHLIAYFASFGLSFIATNTIGDYYNQYELLAAAKHYVEKASEGGGSMTLIINGLGIINLLLWKSLSKIDKNMTLYLGTFNFGVCIWNTFQGVDITLATRLSVFFLLTITLIVPYYGKLTSLRSKFDINQFSQAFFILLFTSYFAINIYSFLQHGGRMSNIPYQTIFFHKDYYNLQ